MVIDILFILIGSSLFMVFSKINGLQNINEKRFILLGIGRVVLTLYCSPNYYSEVVSYNVLAAAANFIRKNIVILIKNNLFNYLTKQERRCL
jgi:hypothetical protein